MHPGSLLPTHTPSPTGRGLGRGNKIKLTTVFIPPLPGPLPEGEGMLFLFCGDGIHVLQEITVRINLIIHDVTSNSISSYRAVVFLTTFGNTFYAPLRHRIVRITYPTATRRGRVAPIAPPPPAVCLLFRGSRQQPAATIIVAAPVQTSRARTVAC